MNHGMPDTASPGGSGAGAASDSAYRIREAEARLERRIAGLEGRLVRSRWLARLGVLSFVASVAAVVLAFRALAPEDGVWAVDSVSTQEVVLRDADGVERGRLATDPDGRAHLALSDREGRARIRLTVLADGSPGVTIHDGESRPRAVLGYLPDGTANLVFADAEGVSRAVLGLEPDGSTQAHFADRFGTLRTLIGVGADGAPSVSTFPTP
jgi:hypothetical protein